MTIQTALIVGRVYQKRFQAIGDQSINAEIAASNPAANAAAKHALSVDPQKHLKLEKSMPGKHFTIQTKFSN